MSKKMNVTDITKQLQESAVAGFARSGPISPPQDEPVKTIPRPVRRSSGKPLTSPEQTQVDVVPQRGRKLETNANGENLNMTTNIASNMTILQFDDTDIEELRQPAYQAQTFRLTEREIEWVKDCAYKLSKEVRRGKVSQADILRISFKLFEGTLATNKAGLLKILDKIK